MVSHYTHPVDLNTILITINKVDRYFIFPHLGTANGCGVEETSQKIRDRTTLARFVEYYDMVCDYNTLKW